MNSKTRKRKRRYKAFTRCDKGALKLCFNYVDMWFDDILHRRIMKAKRIVKTVTCGNN